MNRELRPKGVASPAANYALAICSENTQRLVHTAGIVGDRADGTISDDIGEQAVEMWRSVDAVLGEVGMSAVDIVSYTTYAVAGNDLAAVMAARDAYLGGHRAASTLVPVPALARPYWKVEVQVIAAR